MFSTEKTPLTGSTDEKARKALTDLSASLGNDEENPYMASKAPAAAAGESLPARVRREVKNNWWLWGAIIFAILLVGGLFVFRNRLYDRSAQGLPFLAVKENAAEACATECNEEQVSAAALAAGEGGDKDSSVARVKEEFDTCYSKCVAQETKDVQEEREKFRKNEEAFEKEQSDDEGSKEGSKKHQSFDDDDDDSHKGHKGHD